MLRRVLHLKLKSEKDYSLFLAGRGATSLVYNNVRFENVKDRYRQVCAGDLKQRASIGGMCSCSQNKRVSHQEGGWQVTCVGNGICQAWS